jgi:hypothetical protein
LWWIGLFGLKVPQAFNGRLDDIGFVFSAKKLLVNRAQRSRAFFVSHHNISVNEICPLLVLVLMKFNTCPALQEKYSGTFAGSRAALVEVTVAATPTVT